MKKLFYILLLLVPVVVCAQQGWAQSTPMNYAWKYVGNAGFSAGSVAYTSLAFSSSGQPYVAYQDSRNSNKITVMKFDNTNWINVGNAGFSSTIADNISLAFNPTGQPYVVYGDGGNFGKATVMKFDGSNWVNVGIAGFSAGNALNISLAFSPSGCPCVAYIDGADSNKATVMSFDGTNWVKIGNSGFSAGEVSYPSLVVSPSGEPYVAFVDIGNSYKATVMKYDSVYFGISKQQKSRLSIYPNPVSDYITIETSAITNTSQLSISNLSGQEVITRQITEQKTQLDISSLPQGIYFVRLTNDKTITMGKLIKE